MSPEPSWKDKYLKELETSEMQEMHWEAEKNLLQRMLVRTSLAAEGQSPDLDKLLVRVREEIRKGRFDARVWEDLQDSIGGKVSTLDDLKSESDSQLRDTLGKLLAELHDYEAFQPFKHRLRDLKKRLRKTDSLRQLCTEWLVEFASILHAGLEGGSGPGARQPSQTGLFGKLFGKPADDGPQDDSVPPAPDDTGGDLPVELETPGGEEVDQRLRIARRVSQLLEQMLEQVSLEPESEARARRLQKTLLASDDWDELKEGLSGVADLVIAAVSRSQREFEAFLRKLDERLDTLRKYFAEQEHAQAGRLGASAELELEIQRELEAFGQRVDDSEDFQGLKASVSGHLKSLREAVARFRAKESEREKFLSEQLETMQHKMAAMEAQEELVKAELREQRSRATTDVLTQLPNREALRERLDLELQRWHRYGNPLSLALLDIDFFKRFNDSYGHKAGDRVLQLVAKALQDRLRQTDFIARFGGEEFVVLLPETSPEVAKEVLDDLRSHIRKLPFHFRGEPVFVTFSAGVAGFEPDDQSDSVFDRADRALYQAKNSGRDQICASDHQG